MVIPSWLKEEYPFRSNYFKLKNGFRLHYIDQGVGDVILMLHGNPTWSYYYRNLVKGLNDKFRVIVPDHLGCGLSDKPLDFEYTLSNHIDHICQLLDGLSINKLKLIVHDWGGAIGMGVAKRRPDLIEKITFLNTAAFTSDYIPMPIALCRIPWLGEKLIRNFNGFAWPATFMAVENKMPKKIKAGYLYPYKNKESRVAIARFVQDIPMEKKHQSYQQLLAIENNLKEIKCPKQFVWGKKDFCFNDYFLNRWKKIYPEAQFNELGHAGHYVLEDDPTRCLKEIRSFM